MSNHEYPRKDLYEKFSYYLENRDQFQSQAEQRVSQWKYAETSMYHPLPYEDLIQARTDRRWTRSKRQWLEAATESCWWHGYDDTGQLQLIKHSTSGATLVFSREEGHIDVVSYGGYPKLIRYCPNDTQIDRVYECSMNPLQYSWEDFHYEQGVCVSSVESTAYKASEDEWEQCKWKKKYRYVTDAAGLAEVYRDYEIDGSGEVRIFGRRGSKPPAKPLPPLLFAYSMKLATDDEEDMEETAQADASGFEMNLDHDVHIDKVLFAPPQAIEAVLNNTDLASVPRTSVGITRVATDTDLASLVGEGATWMLVDASASNAAEQITAAAESGMSVLLQIDNKKQLAQVLGDGSPPLAAPQQFAIAATATGVFAKRSMNVLRKEAAKLGLGEPRIVGVVSPEELSKLNPDARKLGLDGYLLFDTEFDTAVSILDRLAPHL